jgi:hypothetical protein
MIVLIFIIAFLAASPETGKTLIGIDPLFGLDPVQGEDARASGPISALWYAVFILPMFLFTPDAGGRRAIKGTVRDGSEGIQIHDFRSAATRRYFPLFGRAHDLPGWCQRLAGAWEAVLPPPCSAGRSPKSAFTAFCSMLWRFFVPLRKPPRHAARIQDWWF